MVGQSICLLISAQLSVYQSASFWSQGVGDMSNIRVPPCYPAVGEKDDV